jgi:hypothetical protein
MPGRASQASGFLLAAGLYAAAFVLLAWPWLSGTLTIPWDAKAQFEPEMQFLATSLARGDSPFWTPNVFAGWPQIADPQSLIFSPLHLALASLDAGPSFRAIDAVTFAYLFLGGLAIILFFRDRGWHWGGAVVAALVFAFGGSAASRLQHTSEIVSLCWLPISLWLLARVLDRRSLSVAPLAGIAIGMLAIGRDQVALLGLYVVVAYVLAWWLDGAGRLKRIRSTVAPLAISAATASAVAIVPVVFSALLAADSNRPAYGLAGVGRGSLHPALLPMLVFSDLYGASDPTVDFWGPPSAPWHTAFGSANPLHLSQNMGQIYCGILAVILILGIGIFRGLLWTRDIRFFTAALVLMLLYALGWYTPIFRLMFDVLPGVDLFRRPADATFIIGFLIAIMGGYLVHRVLSGTAPRPRFAAAIEGGLIAALVPVALVIAYAVNRADVAVKPIVVGLAFAVGAIALLELMRRLVPTRPLLAGLCIFAFVTFDLAWNNAPTESTGLPASRYRALQLDGGDETVALLKTKLAETSSPTRRDRVELIGIAYHWPDVALAQGFDHLFGHNPLRLRNFVLATGVGDTVAIPEQRKFAPLFPSYHSTFANLCGVRFIATGVPVERIDPSLHPGDLTLVARTGEAYVYENPGALPRVMFVRDYRIADFDALLRDGWPDVDPQRTVLLEHPPAREPIDATRQTADTAAGGTVAVDAGIDDPKDAQGTTRILRYANTAIEIEVDAPSGGFLVLNDVWHPWWRAAVDGRPTEILKANVLFRAVELEPGRHHVHFEFDPLRGAWDELKAKLAALM